MESVRKDNLYEAPELFVVFDEQQNGFIIAFHGLILLIFFLHG